MTHKTFSFSLHKGALGLAVLAVASAYQPVMAEQQQSGFTLTPSLGHITHSNYQGVENDTTYSLSGGYQFASPWAAELSYLSGSPGIKNSGDNADEEQVRLDALYFFDREEKFQPYTVFGGGSNTISGNALDFDDAFVNAGLGFKYAFNEIVALRSDVRLLHNLDSSAFQTAVNLGVSFLIGGSEPRKQVASAEKDSDMDGVLDRIDSCPGTVKGTTVDANGCPVVSLKDSDGDGIKDTADQCPGTQVGAKVDEKGCYIVLTESVNVRLQVQFANNSDEVLNPADTQFQKLATFMKEYPNTRTVIEGHTDDRGSAAYNKQLSHKRAQSVVRILNENFGIAEDRFSAVGYGEEKPIADNASAEGRAQNRRVEAVVSATVERIAK